MGKTYKGHIKGNLRLNEGDDAGNVTSLGGSVYAGENAQIDLAACTSIGGYDLPDPETAKVRLIEVAKHALSEPKALDMGSWHNQSSCGTSHCIAGWAVHLHGADGYELERKVSQPAAGNILLGLEASRLFFLDNDKARSALFKVLEEAGEKPLEPAVGTA